MLFLLFLLNIVSCFITPYNILCPNKKSSDKLIYLICAYDKICAELYDIPFIENIGYIPYDLDSNIYYKNFHYIIKKIGLSYPMLVSTFLTGTNNRTTVINEVDFSNGLLYKIWSSQWRRCITRINYIVFENIDIYSNMNDLNYVYNKIVTTQTVTSYNSTIFLDNLFNFNQNFNECISVEYDTSSNGNTSTYLYNNFFNLTSNQFLSNMESINSLDVMNGDDLKTQNIILSTLYILELYKKHMFLNETCNDINERLYFDVYSNEMRCVCLEGKSCDSDSNDIDAVLWIVLFGIVMIIIVCFVIIYTSLTLLNSIKIKNK
jgi:hypothetical protein